MTSTINDSFHRQFHHPHVVLPVIHVTDEAQALRNVALAHQVGADGVFLINHAISSRELLTIHAKVVEAFPDWWIGVNCLDLHPQAVFSVVSHQVAGVWTDNAMIDEARQEQPAADAVLAARRQHGWRGLYFGGVAFKYQRPVHDLRTAATRARQFMDVITTSGPGTGRAAHIDKIRTMKAAIGGFPLAIASGITPANIADYLPHSDCYLVATGISKSFEELDGGLTKQLIETVRAYDNGQRLR
jgi:hypothetical protein